MDINGTRFHMLTGENDWEPLLFQHEDSGLWWDREKGSVSLLPKVFDFGRRGSETPLSAADRRGAARDTYGHIYWIGDDRKTINVLPAGTKQAGTFWTTADLHDEGGAPDTESVFTSATDTPVADDIDPILQGLAVTGNHYLVVGTLASPGLLVFDLHAGERPDWLRWPHNTAFSPMDLCPAVDGGVWILDRDLDRDEASIWRLDRYFRLVPVEAGYTVLQAAEESTFTSEAGESREIGQTYIPRPTDLDAGSPVAVYNATAIESLGDESLLVLGESEDGGCSVIHRFMHGRERNRFELQGGVLEKILAEPRLRVHDLAFVAGQTAFPGTVAGTLTVVVRHGNQAFAFELFADDEKLDLNVLPRYLPLRRFGGKALLAAPDSVYYDMGDHWYPVVEQPRRRYVGEGFIGGLTTDGLILDGKQPGCVWHRIVIDGCIPADSELTIYTRCDDDRNALPYQRWHAEPAPVLRHDGSEIVLHEPFTDADSGDGTGTWELLIQNAQGRYLAVGIHLSGNGRVSPRIHALRVYYPRFSYLEKYLPSAYAEEPAAADFLERYLANAEGFFTVLEQRIAAFNHWLDTRTVPPEYLEWLAGWLGALLNPRWDDGQRRLFVDHAELLFRWRGTQIGLRALLRLAIDPCPDESIFDELRSGRSSTPPGGAAGNAIRIIERFLLRELPGVVLGDPTTGGGLRSSPASTDLSELGDEASLHERYRRFLFARYERMSAGSSSALNTLNERWQTDYAHFNEIRFSKKAPERVHELPDWRLFIRRELAVAGAWQPEHGVWVLHVRYQEWLKKKYMREHGDRALEALNERWQSDYEDFDRINFSPVLPGNENKAEDWRQFTRRGLGFNYAPVGDRHAGQYRAFLARRYRTVDGLNQAYGLTGGAAWPDFAAVGLPAEDAMPSSPEVLHDWIQFVSLTLPIRRNAHRFTVLVPTEPGELPQSRARRQAQVEEIVQREKPAHTQFDVRLYWALFQVGSARLGMDTTLGGGTRYVAVMLGASYLGQGVLDHGHPRGVRRRRVIGRDRVQRTIHTSGESNNE